MSEPTSRTIAHQRNWPKPPYWVLAGAVIAIVASWIPLAWIARARFKTSADPRVQIVQDMGTQPKYTPQLATDLFEDGRIMRPVIPNTVARGQLEADDHYDRGFTQRLNAQTGKWEVQFFKGMPKQVALDEKLLRRGQERFNIYCATCHGLDGSGNGPVNARAVEMQESKWVQAASLHSETVRGRPDGHIYNTINNGIRNMPGYGAQVPVHDRWAIVAYLRALQFSQNAPARVVPADKLQTLR